MNNEKEILEQALKEWQEHRGKIQEGIRKALQEEENEKPSHAPDEDMVNNPSHYQSLDAFLNIDCITAMQAAFGRYETAIFCKLNAFKYVWRASSKNGNEDIDKALWYLEKYRKLGGEEQ